MPEQLVIHETASFEDAVFNALEVQLEEFLNQIPEPAAVPSKEVKLAAKMGDVKEAEATTKLEALKSFNSFLPTQLVLAVMLSKLRSYKQADKLEKLLTKIIDKMWAHGTLGGIDILAMLIIVDGIAATSAALGNGDAIKYLNEVEKIKAAKEAARKAAEAAKKAGEPKTVKKSASPKAE
jgi:hypothetical protein